MNQLFYLTQGTHFNKKQQTFLWLDGMTSIISMSIIHCFYRHIPIRTLNYIYEVFIFLKHKI